MAHKIAVLALAALAFACWCIYLGGLSALQHDTANSGKNTYRFEWWIFSYEFFIIAFIFVVTAIGHLHNFRAAGVGLFAIAAVYYSYYGNIYLEQVLVLPVLDASDANLRATVAGLISTAVCNFLLVIALGHEDGVHVSTAHHNKETTAAAVAV